MHFMGHPPTSPHTPPEFGYPCTRTRFLGPPELSVQSHDRSKVTSPWSVVYQICTKSSGSWYPARLHVPLQFTRSERLLETSTTFPSRSRHAAHTIHGGPHQLGERCVRGRTLTIFPRDLPCLRGWTLTIFLRDLPDPSRMSSIGPTR